MYERKISSLAEVGTMQNSSWCKPTLMNANEDVPLNAENVWYF